MASSKPSWPLRPVFAVVLEVVGAPKSPNPIHKPSVIVTMGVFVEFLALWLSFALGLAFLLQLF